MEFQIDMRVLELLASRLCHDIVGPVGAVNNGMEMLEDDEFGMADDAVALCSKSARQAANALQFYRMAYGQAGSRVGPDFSDIRDMAAAHLEHSKSNLDWSDTAAPEGAPDGFAKLLLNMIALAEESLPRGGQITVRTLIDGNSLAAVVAANGTDCRLRPESEEALADGADIGELTPRSVQGYFTRQVAKRLGGDLRKDASPDSMQFSAILPK